MLRRDRQLRTQLYQFKDAALFVLALWLAHFARSHMPVDLWDRPAVQPFSEFAWLYLIIAPGAPLVLELQGFYRRPLVFSRWLTAWLLLKSCTWVTFGVIGVLFLFQMKLARLVIIFFGVISYLLVFLSEELMRWAYRSKFAEWQFRKRVLLVGAPEDTARMRAE